MPLAKRVSSIWRKPKDQVIKSDQDESASAFNLSVVHEDVEPPSGLVEEILTENESLKVMNDQMLTQLSVYQAESDKKNQEVAEAASKFDAFKQQNIDLAPVLEQSLANVTALETQMSQLKRKVAKLESTLGAVTLEKDTLDVFNEKIRDDNAKLRSELAQSQRSNQERNQEYQSEKNRIRRVDEENQNLRRRVGILEGFEQENKTLRNRVNVLEDMSRWMKEQSNTGIEAVYEERLALMKTIESLKQEVSSETDRLSREKEQWRLSWNAEKASLTKEKEELSAQILSEEQNASHAFSALDAIQTENQNLTQRIEELVQLVPALQERAEYSLGSSNWPATARMILTMRMIGQQATENTSPATQQFRQTGSVASLSAQCLDVRLSETETQRFMTELLEPESGEYCQRVGFKLCGMCNQVKFFDKNPPSHRGARKSLIDEFSTGSAQFPCCGNEICLSCLLPAIIDSVKWDWWHGIGSLQWIKCPREGCGELLQIRYSSDLERFLRQLGDSDVIEHVKMFEKAQLLRKTLESLSTQPSVEELVAGEKLHRRLLETGRMYSFFNSRYDSTMVDESGCVPEFNPGRIFPGQMDRSGGDLTVPIFIKFFRRQTTPKECILCTTSRYEINYGSVEAWVETCDGLEGSWMWDILLYPTKMTIDCDHEFDTCKTCMAQQITTQLESNGCDRIPCPHCSRSLEFNEIKQFATAEVFQKYENLLLRKKLSSDPNFRWCLRASCCSGQLYDNEEGFDPRIACEECAYEMCFNHQMPWHEGLTCEEYDSQREHGDPNFNQTREWISQHTKQCPGCHVGIVKDAGCFHMTCRSCHHEWCWECLASWDAIKPDDGDYVREGHNEGCWFRTGDLEPTQVAGNDLQAALGT